MASSFRRRSKPEGRAQTPSLSPEQSGWEAPSLSAASSTPPSARSASSWLAGLPGTKPSWGSSGVALTSTGLSDLDALLGGGQPLGTCLLIALDDRAHSSLGSCLLRYWCAEALSHGHHLLVPVLGGDDEEEDRSGTAYVPSPWTATTNDSDEELWTPPCNRDAILRLLRSVPRNRLFSVTDRRERDGGSGMEQADGLGTLREEDEEGERLDDNDDDDDDDDDGDDHNDEGEEASRRNEAEANLKNAWQYSKAEQSKRQGGAHRSRGATNLRENFCQKYDLSGNWSDGHIPNGLPTVPEKAASLPPIRWDSSFSRRLAGIAFFNQLCDHVQSLLSLPPSRPRVVRLLLYMPGDGDTTSLGALAVALPLFLAHVRSELLPVAVLVATSSSLVARSTSSSSLAAAALLLHRTCDAVLEVENFASRNDYPPPAEFRHLHGLLKVRKAATHTGATATGASPGHFADWTSAKRPAAFLYGLKRNRRSLSIPMLHIPPEDYAEGGGSVGAGGVRSGAGRPKDKSALGCSSGGGGGGHLGGSSLDF